MTSKPDAPPASREGEPWLPASIAPRAYWVDPGRVLAGAYPGSPDAAEGTRRIEGLHAAGIRHVLSLMEPDERDRGGRPFISYEADCRRLGISVSHVPIRDVTAPTREVARRALDDIDTALGAGRPVFLHCWGGRGRTGVIVACWLVRHGAEPGEALGRLGRLRARTDDAAYDSPQTEAQRALVRSWQPGW